MVSAGSAGSGLPRVKAGPLVSCTAGVMSVVHVVVTLSVSLLVCRYSACAAVRFLSAVAKLMFAARAAAPSSTRSGLVNASAVVAPSTVSFGSHPFASEGSDYASEVC